MGNGRTINAWLRRVVRKMGYNIYRVTAKERSEIDGFERRLSRQATPAAFGSELVKLRELKIRYANVRLPIATHSLWGARGNSETKPDFRGGGMNAYVGSYAGSDPLCARVKFFVFADAVRRKDSIGLLGRL